MACFWCFCVFWLVFCGRGRLKFCKSVLKDVFNVTRVGKSLSQVSDPLPQIFVRASRPFHKEERCEGSPHGLN